MNRNDLKNIKPGKYSITDGIYINTLFVKLVKGCKKKKTYLIHTAEGGNYFIYMDDKEHVFTTVGGDSGLFVHGYVDLHDWKINELI